MKHYDAIVVGHGIGALSSAVYLSKRLENVALLTMGVAKKNLFSSISVKDSEGYLYKCDLPIEALGVDIDDGILSYFLNKCGCQERLKTFPHQQTNLVRLSGHSLARPNTLEEYKIYLVRHYPKAHRAIERFFNDLDHWYLSYKNERMKRLSNHPYTVDLMTAQWASKSAFEALEYYFKDPRVLFELSQFYFMAGYNLHQIAACDYFLGLFTTLLEPIGFIDTKKISLKKLIGNHLTAVEIIDDAIESVVVENERIVEIKTQKQTIQADAFIIDVHPETFISEYVEENKGFLLEMIPEQFKFKSIHSYRYQAFIGVSNTLKQQNILEKEYLFEYQEGQAVHIVAMHNLSAIGQGATDKTRDGLIVTFIAKDLPQEKDVIESLSKWIPGFDQKVCVFKIVNKRPIVHSHKESKLSSKIIDRVLHHKALTFIKNAYFIGSYYKGAAGASGLIINSIEVANQVERALYENVDVKGFSHEQLLAMFLHSLKELPTQTQEKRIVFTLERIMYQILIQQNQVAIVKTFHEKPDLELTVHAIDLAELLIRGDDLVEKKRFDYQGDQTLYQEIVETIANPPVQKVRTYESLTHAYGRAFFFMTMVLSIMMIVIPVITASKIAPLVITLAFVIKILIQRFVLKRFVMHDAILLGVFVVWSLGYRLVDHWDIPVAYLALGMSGMLFLTAFLGKPIVDDYIYRDFHPNYTNSGLYQTLISGLSIVWSIAYFILFLTMLTLIGHYRLLGLFFMFVMFFLHIHYPSNYVKSLVKARR